MALRRIVQTRPCPGTALARAMSSAGAASSGSPGDTGQRHQEPSPSAGEEERPEDPFVVGPTQGRLEWNGPTRGGRRPEPTRFGDWESNGRAVDF